MKHCPFQSGLRRNTASSRQHDLRLVSSPLVSQPLRQSRRSIDSDQHEIVASSTTQPSTSTAEDSPNEATNRKEETDLPRTKRERGRGTLQATMTEEMCLVDVLEAARFLAVSVSTLYGWAWQSKISFVKVGRALRFDIADLRRFIEDNRIHSRSECKL